MKKQTANGAVTFVIPFYENSQELTGQLQAIRASGSSPEVIVFDERANRNENAELSAAQKAGDVRYFSRAHRNRAALFNDGIRQARNAIVCILPPDIYPQPEFCAAVNDGFQENDAAVVYTDYVIEEGGKEPRVEKLWPFQNNIDERFSLGFFRIYSKNVVLATGGFNEDLNYAEEYDFRLRIQDTHNVIHLDQPLYRSVVRQTEAADPVLSKLHSPGQGAKGGFSYLFYTPEMEREIEYAFKNYLKRQNCFLVHDNREVPYQPDEAFETRVSIVIPILNRKRFIRHTIDRVLKGTFADFEILVVDNGSTDGTQDEVRAISDERVRLVQHDGKCIAEALNRGIREARGKYIAQLDSDDEYVPETLQTMVDYMETHPKCGLAISYYDLIDIDSNVIEELGVIKHLEYDRNNILRVDGGGALRFFHKKVLEEFGLYNVENYGNFGEDYDMVLKVSEHYDVDRVHKVLYRYRRHDDNTDVQRPAAMKVYNKNNARQDALKRRLAINSK
ncbi:MAG: glycosyltransferase [Deferribacteres bacterium]|nr:glycosyltransferase [Deferribacteres bacterium]